MKGRFILPNDSRDFGSPCSIEPTDYMQCWKLCWGEGSTANCLAWLERIKGKGEGLTVMSLGLAHMQLSHPGPAVLCWSGKVQCLLSSVLQQVRAGIAFLLWWSWGQLSCFRWQGTIRKISLPYPCHYMEVKCWPLCYAMSLGLAQLCPTPHGQSQLCGASLRWCRALSPECGIWCRTKGEKGITPSSTPLQRQEVGLGLSW